MKGKVFQSTLCGVVVGVIASTAHARDPGMTAVPAFSKMGHNSPWSGGIGGSFLPNVGISIWGNYLFSDSGNSRWSAELEGTSQFLDDKTFADDGGEEAGSWTQLKLGLVHQTPWLQGKRSNTRFGIVHVKAEGAPNFLQIPGDHTGVYAAWGFDTPISNNMRIGPELSVNITPQDGEMSNSIFPQLTGRISWDNAQSCIGRCVSRGELYTGIGATVYPNPGPFLEIGQKIYEDQSTVSVEGALSVQKVESTIVGADDGDWAEVRLGLKHEFNSAASNHPTLRYGIGWFRSTAVTKEVDTAADYLNVYLGLGYEWEISDRISIEPEINIRSSRQEQESNTATFPQAILRLSISL